MALPALAGIGLLISAIISALVAFFQWFIKFATKRFIIVVAVITAIAALTSAFYLAIQGLLDLILIATPPFFEIAASWCIPNNAPVCFSAIFSAHVLRWVYMWQVKILEYKL